jgi:hypothetical protein
MGVLAWIPGAPLAPAPAASSLTTKNDVYVHVRDRPHLHRPETWRRRSGCHHHHPVFAARLRRMQPALGRKQTPSPEAHMEEVSRQAVSRGGQGADHALVVVWFGSLTSLRASTSVCRSPAALSTRVIGRRVASGKAVRKARTVNGRRPAPPSARCSMACVNAAPMAGEIRWMM